MNVLTETFVNIIFISNTSMETRRKKNDSQEETGVLNLKNIYFIGFLQRGRERDRELETSMREKYRSAASCTPPIENVPANKVHALDRNRTWTFQSAGRCSIH